MAAMSDRLEFLLASHILGSGTFSKPATIAIALCKDPPTDSKTGATINEISNANGYARQTLNPSSSNWLDPILADGNCGNLATITFPADVTADWGWVSGVAITSSATFGAGDMYFYGALTTPKLIQVGDQMVFGISGITIQMDN